MLVVPMLMAWLLATVWLMSLAVDLILLTLWTDVVVDVIPLPTRGSEALGVVWSAMIRLWLCSIGSRAPGVIVRFIIEMVVRVLRIINVIGCVVSWVSTLLRVDLVRLLRLVCGLWCVSSMDRSVGVRASVVMVLTLSVVMHVIIVGVKNRLGALFRIVVGSIAMILTISVQFMAHSVTISDLMNVLHLVYVLWEGWSIWTVLRVISVVVAVRLVTETMPNERFSVRMIRVDVIRDMMAALSIVMVDC